MLILFLKAESLPLFATTVDISGHVNSKGTFVAPYRATRRKRPATPPTADLFAQEPKPAPRPAPKPKLITKPKAKPTADLFATPATKPKLDPKPAPKPSPETLPPTPQPNPTKEPAPKTASPLKEIPKEDRFQVASPALRQETARYADPRVPSRMLDLMFEREVPAAGTEEFLTWDCFKTPFTASEQAKVDRITQDLQQTVNRLMARAVPWMAITKTAIIKVLENGEFLNQSLTGNSCGALNPEKRELFEEATWAVTGDREMLKQRKTRRVGENRVKSHVSEADAHERPKYGYLADVDDHDGDGTKREAQGPYGNIRVRFKTHVRNRATWTSTDSLHLGILNESAKKGDYHDIDPTQVIRVPSPVNKPHWSSATDIFLNSDLTKPPTTIREVNTMYLEAQYHGRLTADDIEEIVLPYGPQYEESNQDLIDAIKKAGIPWRFRG